MESHKSERLPLFPRIFLWVTSVFCAWGLTCSVPMFVIVLFVLVPNVIESPHMSLLGHLGWGGLIVALLVQVIFLGWFLLASIRLLKLSARGLKAFRIGLWIVNGYLILVALGQIAMLMFVDRPVDPFLYSVVAVSSGLAIVVLWLSLRMLQCLASGRVQSLLK